MFEVKQSYTRSCVVVTALVEFVRVLHSVVHSSCLIDVPCALPPPIDAPSFVPSPKRSLAHPRRRAPPRRERRRRRAHPGVKKRTLLGGAEGSDELPAWIVRFEREQVRHRHGVRHWR